MSDRPYGLAVLTFPRRAWWMLYDSDGYYNAEWYVSRSEARQAAAFFNADGETKRWRVCGYTRKDKP